MLFLTEFNFSKINNINIISISNLETIIRSSMTSLKFYGRAEISEI